MEVTQCSPLCFHVELMIISCWWGYPPDFIPYLLPFLLYIIFTGAYSQSSVMCVYKEDSPYGKYHKKRYTSRSWGDEKYLPRGWRGSIYIIYSFILIAFYTLFPKLLPCTRKNILIMLLKNKLKFIVLNIKLLVLYGH